VNADPVRESSLRKWDESATDTGHAREVAHPDCR
jgi:hypothetical protein